MPKRRIHFIAEQAFFTFRQGSGVLRRSIDRFGVIQQKDRHGIRKYDQRQFFQLSETSITVAFSFGDGRGARRLGELFARVTM